MIEYGEYNGHPTITIKESPDDKRGITFGTQKALLVLAHMEDIKKFCYSKKPDFNSKGSYEKK